MGVKGLLSFAVRRTTPVREVYSTQGDAKCLCIDAIGFALFLFAECDAPPPDAGPSFPAFAARVQQLVADLRRGGCEPVFYFDGATDPAKLSETRMRKRQEYFDSLATMQALLLAPAARRCKRLPPLGTEVCFRQTLWRLGCRVVDAPLEADPEIARDAALHRSPVVSNDSDFLVHDQCPGLVLFEELRCGAFGGGEGGRGRGGDGRGEEEKFCVVLRVLQPARVAAALRVSVAALPAVAALAGHDASPWTSPAFAPLSLPDAAAKLLRNSLSAWEQGLVDAARARYAIQAAADSAGGGAERATSAEEDGKRLAAAFRAPLQLRADPAEFWWPRGSMLLDGGVFPSGDALDAREVLLPLLLAAMARHAGAGEAVLEYGPPAFDPRVVRAAAAADVRKLSAELGIERGTDALCVWEAPSDALTRSCRPSRVAARFLAPRLAAAEWEWQALLDRFEDAGGGSSSVGAAPDLGPVQARLQTLATLLTFAGLLLAWAFERDGPELDLEAWDLHACARRYEARRRRVSATGADLCTLPLLLAPRLEFSFGPHAVALEQVLDADRPASAVWPAGVVLAELVWARRDALLGAAAGRGRRALELGCGDAALVSLACAAAGGDVLATDLDVDACVRATKQALARVSLPGSVRFAALDWTTGSPASNPLLRGFDLVLMADVIYSRALHVALASTLAAVLRGGSKDCVALLCWQVRKPAEEAGFFAACLELGVGKMDVKLGADWRLGLISRGVAMDGDHAELGVKVVRLFLM